MAITARVNDVIKLVAGEAVAFTDPELAGQYLGSVLDAGRGGCWCSMMCGRRATSAVHGGR